MELRIERRELLEAVTWAARALPARSPVPLLGGLLLEAEGDRLRLSGQDYEASACAEAEARTRRPGRALVMGRRLLDVCKVLPDGPVDCAVEDAARLTLNGGGARFGLSLLPPEEYPAPPALPEARGRVDAETFAAAVGQVSPAAGRDDTLPALTGIHLTLTGETMTLAATDRYRYALRTIPWQPQAPADTPTEALVPSRHLTEISRALSTRPGEVSLALDSHTLGLSSAARHTTTRLLEGRLPRPDKLFALDGTHATATVDRAALTEAVKRVAVVAERDSPVELAFTGGTVRLQAGYENDLASQHVPSTLEGAESLTVGFNPAYLLDALTTFTAPTVRLHLQGPGQRALLTTDSTHRHLLMSMRPALL
ncbi:DNA polymerase III subunit beta [Streptomyces sp. MUM 203J]|uniref:DNA polymerase III subunit beta n=1 Tax=Streptomyces sp. MUM 203J TaxID=2791990 RepID=UPI001F0359B8|nr:DNA polymerase III subunit beta [Streptomyces sp. MUM 203J]MCH0541864.1 DNA polymerase III subunit beta [Streptomyces sp. MUM 203J]